MRVGSNSRGNALARYVRLIGPVLLVFGLAGCTTVKEHWEKCTRFPDHPDCEIERLPSGK